jgi:hypothetical protein
VKKRLSHDPMILGTCAKYPEGRGHIRDEYIQYRRSHSRDRRDRNKRDYTPFHTQSDIEPKAEDRDRDHISSRTDAEDRDRDHISSRTEAKIERIMGDRHETPEGKGKGPKTLYDSTQAILNDVARGQRDMMNAITQMAISTEMIQNSVGTIGANVAGGASCSEGQ